MVSYKIFAVVVACKKEDRRETIVGVQRDMDIGKAAGPVVQTEYVWGKVSTKIRSVSLLKLRERAVFPRCETSERLCLKLGISSSCVRSITIIIWREQDAQQMI